MGGTHPTGTTGRKKSVTDRCDLCHSHVVTWKSFPTPLTRYSRSPSPPSVCKQGKSTDGQQDKCRGFGEGPGQRTWAATGEAAILVKAPVVRFNVP